MQHHLRLLMGGWHALGWIASRDKATKLITIYYVGNLINGFLPCSLVVAIEYLLRLLNPRREEMDH